MKDKIKVHILKQEFKVCKKAFIALGDETRQQIIAALLEREAMLCNSIRIWRNTRY